MIVDLWVRDNFTGDVHQIGTNHHDSLQMFANDHGILSVEYVNLQNGEGTFGGGYSFVPRPDIDTGYMQITPEEMFLNEAYIEEKLYKFIKQFKPKYEDPEAEKNYAKRVIKEVVKIKKKLKGFFIT